MRLYIRADADGKIGTGHIMRCIALAQAWKDHGGEVTFISHCEGEALRERISKEGFQFIAVNAPHPHSDDLSTTLGYLKCHSPIWLVLDGYHFTPEYQKAIRDEGIRLLVIDDMNHLSYYHADILLNQNINAPDLKYHCDEDTTLLFGTRYVLLRREFLKYQDFKRQITVQARNILVTLGGADPENVTLKVIEALKLLDEPDISVRIIIGPANSHQESLRKALPTTLFDTELLVNPPNMPELMAWADMAVSGGGSTCWELALFGLPNIIIYCAENQRPIAEKLHEKELALNLGGHTELSLKSIAAAIDKMINNQVIRAKMVSKATGQIDGQGAAGVCQAIEEVNESATFRSA
ncbi:MAG TPA: UDP-2,4-diacetamido-2,4,6-trideoxy-beta-L-altropyranose hydrolase [Syntrophus sp. (in: bacteria)]|nr:UDP-2,4-diacetamido-2,4,6-trideoxy-beta-L-altropyranose hydrolase [Syntrophus sp. (in: bacteria)]